MHYIHTANIIYKAAVAFFDRPHYLNVYIIYLYKMLCYVDTYNKKEVI